MQENLPELKCSCSSSSGSGVVAVIVIAEVVVLVVVICIDCNSFAELCKFFHFQIKC